MKFYKQHRYYTCGCACVRTALSKFYDDVPTEDDMVVQLNTNDQIGTHYDDLIAIADKYDLKTMYGQHGSIDQVDKLTKDGWVVVMGISLDVPHFVIYVQNNGNHLWYYDPFHDDMVARLIKKFSRSQWLVDHTRYKMAALEYGVDITPDLDTKQWFIAYKKK